MRPLARLPQGGRAARHLHVGSSEKKAITASRSWRLKASTSELQCLPGDGRLRVHPLTSQLRSFSDSDAMSDTRY
jgi:hypothetical protein